MILKRRFFLASSDKLRAERDLVELLVGRANSSLIDKHLFLEVIRWEEMLHTLGNRRVQDRFSEEICNCDVMIVLFHAEVGRFTKEEFDIAVSSFKAGRNPRHILVYFKDTHRRISGFDAGIKRILGMRRGIRAAGQMFDDFTHRAELELSLRKQLDLLSQLFEREAGCFWPSEPVISSEATKIVVSAGALKPPRISEVQRIAEAAGMFRKWNVNPHLTFEKGDIMYFWERRHTRARLDAQLRARRLVLEIADKEGIFIPEPGDLSEKAKPIEARIWVAWQNCSKRTSSK